MGLMHHQKHQRGHQAQQDNEPDRVWDVQQNSGGGEAAARARLAVKLVPSEHCSTQPAAVSYAQPSSTRRPSRVAKLLDAYTLP